VISIVLWLWNDRNGRWNNVAPYDATKLIRMSRMVRANLAIPHEIVAVTDYPAHAFPSDIRVVPIWPDLVNDAGVGMGRCWRRLRAFAPEMAELIGPRFVWMDLDAVVMGDLTPLLTRPEDLVLWRSNTTSCPYNGSMVLMTAGCRAQVWSEWTPKAAKARPRLRSGMAGSRARPRRGDVGYRGRRRELLA
jgi:hypothetical protein